MAMAFRLVAAAAVMGLCALTGTAVFADTTDATGVWQETSDTGEVGSYVTIHQVDGLYQGEISKLFLKPDDNPNPICDGCKGDQKGHSYLGLKLLWGLNKHGMKYEGGTIVDPRDGSEYSVELTLSPDAQTLTVRGFVGISLFGKSLEWKRLPADQIPPVAKPVHDVKKVDVKKADIKKTDLKRDHKPVANE